MACSSQPSRSTVEILQELSLQIQSNTISRFNINRRNVWDGACRGFKRSTFAPNNILLVKFTDDTGLSEEAVDQGGPRREFLRLLMDALQNSTLFEGPTTSRILTLNSHAIQRDEYYLAGVMVAVDLVHGGPPPMFFFKILFDMLVFGPENVHPTIDDIPESEFKQSLNSVFTFIQFNAFIIS
ncbi:G2/M phase-specific E3 ubiquitin-protein ligase-like [Saccostrea echinata]|uniref:G2/M phase-specific E3 ubiquitin-protein ligase-like n=1 Tax=Saccostrea echinata TaxID=191078 RepID=UPI002A81CE59|nr:G2/M phase-specific E3 ubiquitin-protein ligase-like [Saccostrea echinata]